ncbi:MAG: hypothetical protein APF76_11945 [Desulfitibacter sp. BRH_c19]|nr:MAG: hypothetical protein APF76_11945 [Desulfitibacter sp. BRH_c19]
MNENQSEKRMLEKAAIELFICSFKEIFGVEYKVVCYQERPDAILEDPEGNRLGMEVTHLFYDELKAKILLGKSNSTGHKTESFYKYLDVLNDLLDKKAKTGLNYPIGYPCSLLIRDTSPVWTKEDFEEANSLIKLPQKVYKDIWLLTQDKISIWSLFKID